MSEMKTVTVSLAQGYEKIVEYHDVGASRSVLQSLDSLLTTCITNDDQEAKQGADTAQCPDRGDFEKQANQIKTDAQNALTSIWNTFTTQIESKANVIPHLMDTMAKQWGEAGGELDTLQGHVKKHMEADDWSSKGAQKYKESLPTQSKALNEFEEMCYRAQIVISSAAGINATVFESVYSSFVKIKGELTKAADIPVQNLQYWSDSGASADSKGCVSYLYYRRTSAAKANLESLNEWFSKFVTTRGEWSSTTQTIADDIPGVRDSVQNLKHDGTWPEPKAVSTAEANVDDQTGGAGTGGETSTAPDTPSGVDLNNEGGIFG